MTKRVTKYQPRRGRPDRLQTAAIDNAILTTARRQFLRLGYDAVGIEGVAAEAGVSKGTVYARYQSKEELFTAVVKASVRDWSHLASANDRFLSEDIGERLRHHATTIAGALVQPDVRAFQRLLVANRERFPQLSLTMYEAGYLYIVRLITRDIEDAAARDGIPVRDAAGIAATLVSALTGWHLQESACTDLGADELIRYGNRMVELLLAARERW